MTVLFVNACMRGEQSRTLELCREYLEGKENVVEVNLAEMGLKPFDAGMVAYRAQLQKAGVFDDPIFDLSQQFAKADEIVIGAPYWDLSFPAALKVYIEHVSVCDIAFHYTEDAQLRGSSARPRASPTSPPAAASSRARTSATSTCAASPRCSASPRCGSSPPKGWTSSASTWTPRWTRPAPKWRNSIEQVHGARLRASVDTPAEMRLSVWCARRSPAPVARGCRWAGRSRPGSGGRLR